MEDWHLDKKVSVGHIIITVTLGASIFAWATNLEKQALANQEKLTYLQSQLEYERDQRERQRSEIRDDLKSLSGKLDRVLEKLQQ